MDLLLALGDVAENTDKLTTVVKTEMLATTVSIAPGQNNNSVISRPRSKRVRARQEATEKMSAVLATSVRELPCTSGIGLLLNAVSKTQKKKKRAKIAHAKCQHNRRRSDCRQCG
jgi:hypothetical protein